jgi:hypothetical protein
MIAVQEVREYDGCAIPSQNLRCRRVIPAIGRLVCRRI